MSKRDQIKQHIRDQGVGYKLDAQEVWRVACNFECGRGVVYAAMRELREIKAMEGNVYTARFVRPLELVAALFDPKHDLGLNYCLLTKEREAQLCADLFTTPRLLAQALDWASCYLIVDATFYGMSYRRNDRPIYQAA